MCGLCVCVCSHFIIMVCGLYTLLKGKNLLLRRILIKFYKKLQKKIKLRQSSVTKIHKNELVQPGSGFLFNLQKTILNL